MLYSPLKYFYIQDFFPDIANTDDHDARCASLSVTAGALLNQVCMCVCVSACVHKQVLCELRRGEDQTCNC